MSVRVTKSEFGKTSAGKEVELYILSSSAGIEVGVLTYGGIIPFLRVPDRAGNPVDIVLGFDSIAEYENGRGYLGALIGRCANRIGKGRFTLDGREYTLACNNNGNHLHGGINGFDKKVWSAVVENNKLILSLVSPDGDEGYPGNLSVSVSHSLSDDGVFTWEYFAKTDKDTVCNLTNHSYFNLAGHDSGDVLSHILKLNSDSFTNTDEKLIPTGEILPVEGTPMDFRQASPIGSRINQDYPPLQLAGGYDHNFAVRGKTGVLRSAAFCYEETTGISLELKTTLPGLQFYSGNFLDNVKGKAGAIYNKHSGFCLENQFFPDAVNHPYFEQPILKAGQAFRHTTSIKFSAR